MSGEGPSPSAQVAARCRRPDAPHPGSSAARRGVSRRRLAEVVRTEERVFIGLGANLGDPVAQVELALACLAKTPGLQVLRASRRYGSLPWLADGPAPSGSQPNYVNAVVECRSRLGPLALLVRLHRIEREIGRRRRRGEPRHAPRLIDLDLLAFGQRRVSRPRLTLPHPRWAERAFVLLPWAELAAEFAPDGGATVADRLAALRPAQEVGRLAWAMPERSGAWIPPGSRGGGVDAST